MGVLLILDKPAHIIIDVPVQRRSKQSAFAFHAMAETAVIFLSNIEANLYLLIDLTIEIRGKALVIMAANACRNARGITCVWHFADAVDDPPVLPRPYNTAAGPLENFDTLDVAEIAGVLHIITKTIEIKIVAGGKSTNIDAVKTGIAVGVDPGTPAKASLRLGAPNAVNSSAESESMVCGTSLAGVAVRVAVATSGSWLC